jgi:hypothetical protein
VTPPDNTEQSGSGGTDTSTEEVPPWQRVAQDSSTPSSEGDDRATQWLPSPASQVGTQPPAAPPPQQGGGAAEPALAHSGASGGGLFGQGAGERAQQSGSGGETSGSIRSVSAFRRPGRGPRRANLQVKRVDPWSVLKLSLVLGVALFFVWLVAVGVLYMVLDGMGVWDNLNGTYNSLVANDGADDELLITAGTVFGAAAIVGAVNIVLISALTTVGAFVYNVCAGLTGGLELTLSERE